MSPISPGARTPCGIGWAGNGRAKAGSRRRRADRVPCKNPPRSKYRPTGSDCVPREREVKLVMDKVNINEKMAQFSDQWKPKIVGELNGQQVKLVKFQG